MDPHIHALDNLSHARWKVSFIRHLLQAHLASPWKGTLAWQAQHAEFLHRLATAEDELALCQAAPAIIDHILGGRGEQDAARAEDPVQSEIEPRVLIDTPIFSVRPKLRELPQQHSPSDSDSPSQPQAPSAEEPY